MVNYVRSDSQPTFQKEYNRIERKPLFKNVRMSISFNSQQTKSNRKYSSLQTLHFFLFEKKKIYFLVKYFLYSREYMSTLDESTLHKSTLKMLKDSQGLSCLQLVVIYLELKKEK